MYYVQNVWEQFNNSSKYPLHLRKQKKKPEKNKQTYNLNSDQDSRMLTYYYQSWFGAHVNVAQGRQESME